MPLPPTGSGEVARLDSTAASACAAVVRHIPGWFEPADFLVFDSLLSQQATARTRGALLEIGALHGRSAVVLGLHRNTDEVHIIDPWHASTGYTARRDDFEANYRRLVDSPAVIHQARTADVAPELLPPVRFAHIDGGHQFAETSYDLRLACRLLTPAGVVAVDDFRHNRFLEVAAATWDVVNAGELFPFAVTADKLYLAVDPPAASRAGIGLAVTAHRRWGVEVNLTSFRGCHVVRVPTCRWGDLIANATG